jgi:hypothetical protein
LPVPDGPACAPFGLEPQCSAILTVKEELIAQIANRNSVSKANNRRYELEAWENEGGTVFVRRGVAHAHPDALFPIASRSKGHSLYSTIRASMGGT